MAKRKPARKRIESPFAKNLKAILSMRGISQKAAAAMAEVTPATMLNSIKLAVPKNI